jgi:truncated hemoglobin YjbI
MGGPAAMGDDRLESVHKRLNISDDEFNEVVTLLKEAMVEHGMDAQDIADVAQVFEQKRGIIVGSGQ